MFACGSDGLDKIAAALEGAAIQAEKMANTKALGLFSPDEDEVSRREKVECIAQEAFKGIKAQLENDKEFSNKELYGFALQTVLSNVKVITTASVAPFSKSLYSILKTGKLSEEAQNSFTLINSLMPPATPPV